MPLAERFEAWCAGRPTLPKEAEGQGCSRISHPNRHKGLTLTLFQRSSVCLGCCCSGCGCFHVHLSLSYDSLPPAAFCSFTSDHICKLFPIYVETGAVPQLDQGYPPGACQQAAVTQFSPLPAQVKCHVLSGKLWSHLRAEQRAEYDVWSSRLLVLAWGIGP